MKQALLNLFFMVITASTIPVQAQEISAEFPFESNYVAVEGHKLHYIDVGEGNPVLFLHGVPMSSYAWRNVVPHLSDSARCIALDFMGFGKSDKPAIDYSFDEQYRYLEGFIEALNLSNITLVMTDIGGILGQKYARLHPENVKALAFMETPLSDAETFHKNGGMMQHMLFSMGGKDKLGHRMFVKKNMFIKMMPMLIKRKLTKEEKAAYALPYPTEETRIPMFALVNGFPKKGRNAQPGDMGDYLNKNGAWLPTSTHPKLVLVAKPGMLMTKKVVAWAETNLTNLQVTPVGKAKHLMEEDLPHEIGRAINAWLAAIETAATATTNR